jgi:hypothetical protein
MFFWALEVGLASILSHAPAGVNWNSTWLRPPSVTSTGISRLTDEFMTVAAIEINHCDICKYRSTAIVAPPCSASLPRMWTASSAHPEKAIIAFTKRISYQLHRF